MDHVNASDLVYVAVSFMSVVFSVIGWLLSRKDASQEKLIDTLFNKHDAVSTGLQEFRIEVAQKHYCKTELDMKFDKLEYGIMELGKKMDDILQHVMERPK